jgi:aminopeptidase-like protein
MAKGKGLMQTYWCDPSSPNFNSDGSALSTTMASSETSSENEFEG